MEVYQETGTIDGHQISADDIMMSRIANPEDAQKAPRPLDKRADDWFGKNFGIWANEGMPEMLDK